MALFRGIFLPKKKDKTEEEESDRESDSDDDFEDHDFRDMHKIAQQTLHYSASFNLPYVVETLQEVSLGNDLLPPTHKIRVRGRFDPLFSHPWWRVEIKTNEPKSSRKMKLASSLPSYSFRTDDASGEDILSLFLKRGCGVDDQHATALLDFIRITNRRPTLVDLQDNLTEFARDSEDSCKIADQIRKFLHNWRKCLEYKFYLLILH